MYSSFKKLALSAMVSGAIFSATANAYTIIDNNTGGLYNNHIGDMASYYGPTQFPGANSSEGDPTINPAVEPTTFPIATFGADWQVANFTGATAGNWVASSNIPNSWAVNTEVAAVYQFDLAAYTDLHLDFGVDNGIYIWLDGDYKYGALRGGGSSINEYDLDLSSVANGHHYLAVLMEDHGGGTGFDILVSGAQSAIQPSVPAPAAFILFVTGLLGLVRARRTA